MKTVPYGDILFLNGTSSAGKTTLARALQLAFDQPFSYYASDQLADAGFRVRPPQSFASYATDPSERERFFDGFHRSIAAFAFAGNNLIVEHIVEEQAWAEDLQHLLAPFRVLWVGVHAPVETLIEREKKRGNRTIGEAFFHLKTHGYCRYDVEVDATLPLAMQIQKVQEAWQARVRQAG